MKYSRRVVYILSGLLVEIELHFTKSSVRCDESEGFCYHISGGDYIVLEGMNTRFVGFINIYILSYVLSLHPVSYIPNYKVLCDGHYRHSLIIQDNLKTATTNQKTTKSHELLFGINHSRRIIFSAVQSPGQAAPRQS